ncbi:MAG: MFS transporter [Myxococcota bacterium]|nr:MFS transporter [Myxococcota bacterium]
MSPLVLGVLAAQGVGFAGSNSMPLLVGSVIDGLGLIEAQAGLLGSTELGALAGVSLLIAPRMGHLSRRRVALLGALLAATGHVLSALAPSFELLLAARLLAGCGAGAAVAAGNAAAASSREPDRLFAVVALLAGTAGAALLVGLPFVIGAFGYSGAFVVLAGIALACLPLLLNLPDAPGGARVPTESASNRGRAFAALGGLLLLALGEGAIWAFTERIGIVAVGLTAGAVGAALAATTAAGLSGAALATWLGLRIGRTAPLAAGIAAVSIATFVLGYATAAGVYLAALLVWGVGFFFVTPYLLGLAAALDSHGRWSAAAAGVSSVGIASGPLAAGLLLTWGSFPALGWLVLACGVTALVLVLPVAARVDRGGLAPG